MAVDPVTVSRAISHALRHDPNRYGLTLDPEGWAAVPDLLDGLRQRGLDVMRDDLDRAVRSSSKRRHEIVGDRIRARYGHSAGNDVQLPPAPPPAVLFHGTAQSTVAAIRRECLLPMRRQHVHLSPDPGAARRVGRRRDADPGVLRVDAAGAADAGVDFRRGNDDTWLADPIPPGFIGE